MEFKNTAVDHNKQKHFGPNKYKVGRLSYYFKEDLDSFLQKRKVTFSWRF